MLELLETQGINALKDYVVKNEQKVKTNLANKSLKELFLDNDIKRVIELTCLIQSQGIVHPKLEKLKKILISQLKDNENSKIIVFCHFRDSVNNIVRFFEKDEIVNVHKFVGQANKVSDKGLTQKEQIKILEDFKKGIYNTLIGTSVAEEGLDIAECDLVVFYDVVPSAIRAIQRRGRTGRKKEGKVYILMTENTRDEGYYWAEKVKERNMRESLGKIKQSEQLEKQGQSNLLDFVEKESGKKVNQKINGADKYQIICDNRETASSVVRMLSLMGVNLKLEQLPIADYVLSNRVGIERKTAQDFSDSIKDGRLFRELIDLKDHFERSILILEGNPLDESIINENALYGAITTIILNIGISIYKTKNSEETANFLYQLAKKEQSESKKKISIRFDKVPLETSFLLEYIVAGIPGVNNLRAKNLLNAFKTLQKLFLADISDLTKVENIGKKIAQDIYKISRYKYKQNE
ncbi:MAG: ERCC4 domain-containing protein, partial [Promethearchaeota archaeon]